MAVEDVFTPKSQKVTDVKGESDEKNLAIGRRQRKKPEPSVSLWKN